MQDQFIHTDEAGLIPLTEIIGSQQITIEGVRGYNLHIRNGQKVFIYAQDIYEPRAEIPYTGAPVEILQLWPENGKITSEFINHGRATAIASCLLMPGAGQMYVNREAPASEQAGKNLFEPKWSEPWEESWYVYHKLDGDNRYFTGYRSFTEWEELLQHIQVVIDDRTARVEKYAKGKK
jgi:hypothetical protein